MNHLKIIPFVLDIHKTLIYLLFFTVSRGIIVGTEQRHDLDSTQLTLQLTKLIRTTSGRDSDINDKINSEYYKYDVDNELEAKTFGGRRRKHRSLNLHAHVHVPSICEAVGGTGEFLMMARRRLGRLSLVCAPRIEDWVRIVEERNADGSSHCLLEH